MSETAKRLLEYHPFPDAVIEPVEKVSESFRRAQNWEDLKSQFAIPEPEVVDVPAAPHGIQVWRKIPNQEYDPSSAIVLHSPMGSCLDPDMLYQASELAETLPDRQVIAFGLPGYITKRYGTVPRNRLMWMFKHGDLEPLVTPRLQYLEQIGVTQAVHTGPSCGSEIATVAADHAKEYGQDVSLCMQVDPVRVKYRPLLRRLIPEFKSTNEHLNKYIARTQSVPFFTAHETGSSFGYNLNLLRLTNIAIAGAFRLPKLESNIGGALFAHPNMKNYLVWAGDSEFHQNTRNDELLGETIGHTVQVLSQKYGDERFKADCLPEQRHAMINDADLMTALILNGLHWANNSSGTAVTESLA